MISVNIIPSLDIKGHMMQVFVHGLHRLEKYLNMQDCLEKYLKNTQRP